MVLALAVVMSYSKHEMDEEAVGVTLYNVSLLLPFLRRRSMLSNKDGSRM